MKIGVIRRMFHYHTSIFREPTFLNIFAYFHSGFDGEQASNVSRPPAW